MDTLGVLAEADAGILLSEDVVRAGRVSRPCSLASQRWTDNQ